MANSVPKIVRDASTRDMSVENKKKIARWRRNKAAERARKSTYPKTLSVKFVDLVLSERDRRASVNPIAQFVIRPNHHFFEPGSYERAIRFAADVWAADTWLKEEWGPKGAMPRRVAKWLDAHGAPHNYSEQSLPKMIRRARQRIDLLERPQSWNGDIPLWEAFHTGF